jgi:hypothetical protein
MLNLVLMVTWFGKKAKRMDDLGADSFAPLSIIKAEKPSAIRFGTALDLLASGNVKS